MNSLKLFFRLIYFLSAGPILFLTEEVGSAKHRERSSLILSVALFELVMVVQLSIN